MTKTKPAGSEMSQDHTAYDIARAVRAQNWKRGGALVLDTDEAEKMIELYAQVQVAIHKCVGDPSVFPDHYADAARVAVEAVRDPVDQLEEDRIDRLRLAAFKSNDPKDRQAYFDATSKWFQDRHYRRMAEK